MVENSEAQQDGQDHPQVALINRVLDKIEDFYFEDGPENGEKLFMDFATKHHGVFDDDVDVDTEHKLE